MPSNAPISPAWRPDLPPAPPRRDDGPGWRREPTATSRHYRLWSPQNQIVVAALGLLVGIGLLVYACTWLWMPRPCGLVLIGADYADNLAVPPNVYGWQGLQDLARLAPETDTTWPGDGLRLVHDPLQYSTQEAWGAALDRVSYPTLVLFLALHGGSDLKGAYLLPQDATSQPEPRNRLRLEDVLARLAKLPAGQKKVLVLDATQVPASWTFGMLTNDFARGLAELEPRIVEIPNLIVLSASDLDQRSWVCEEWRQTFFTHAIIEGLRGAAADGDDNGRISAWELYQNVRDSVQMSVLANRGVRQTPVLLPSGEAGRRRARAIDLVAARPYRAPDPYLTPIFEVPPELKVAWQKGLDLAAEFEPPEAHSPQLWRRYQDQLLRYEQLVRARDVSGAERVKGAMGRLEEEIRRARFLEIGSLEYTLTMPAAAGHPLVVPANPDSLLRTLWDAPRKEYDTRWAKLQAAAGKGQGPQDRLRRQLGDLLLREAGESAANLDRAVELLQIIEGPVQPRPAEVHYLAMLRRDLPPGPLAPDLAEVVALSVRVRREAERAALAVLDGKFAYSELVSPWIAAQVREADGERQQGQDLLFAQDPVSWQTARRHLEAADRMYREAAARAAVFQEGLALRDRAQGILPFYSQWLARRRAPSDPDQQKKELELFDTVQTLWADLHALTRALEPPVVTSQGAGAQAAPSPPAEGAGLPALVGKVRAGLDEVVARYRAQVNALADVALPTVWRDTDDALLVPRWDPRERARLLTNLYRASRRLLIETSQSGGQAAGGMPLALPDEERSRNEVKESAGREGRMVLAVLGEGWFNASGGAEGEDYDQVRQRLRTFAVETKWWESIDQAGAQVARRWVQLPVEINRLTALARRADLDPARVELRTADRLVRGLDGAGGLLLTVAPADLYRRQLVQALLLRQGERTLQDHWYAVDPEAVPYYRVAGLGFADDAARLDIRQHPPQAPVDALRQRLERSGDLLLDGPPRLALTSERSLTVDYRVRPTLTPPGDALPPGYAVVWVDPGKSLQLRLPEAGARLVRRVGADGPPVPVTCQVSSPVITAAETSPPPRPVRDTTSLALRGLYRGQQLLRDTAVFLYPVPEILLSQPPPPLRASLAARGTDEVLGRYGDVSGALVVILDCSGSMGPARGAEFSATTKYAEATQALRKVLARLPRGTVVSLWSFGRALGPEKTVPQAERTIQRLLPPTRWDPADPAQLTRLMAEVEYPALEPWNESPIVRTLLRAREDLRGARGFKTILLLTDGMDNRFATDREYNPDGQPIPTVLRQAFQDSGVEINIVGFKWAEGEEAQARKQFQVIEKLPVPGKFYTVADTRDLVGVLDRAMRPRLRYWVARDDDVYAPGMPASGLGISPDGANDRWYPGGLPPGGYKLWVHTARRLRQDIYLRGGDLLLLDLFSSAGEVRFRRDVYSRSDFPDRPAVEKANWRLANLQNQRVGDAGLQMLLTLEKIWDPREVVLEVLRPRDIWFEASPVGATAPYCTRWRPQPGYPAPAWSLEVPAWPAVVLTEAPAPSRLQVWWNPDQDAPLAASLDRDRDFRAALGVWNQEVPVEGDRVTVESVQVEDHPVEVRPGVREVRPCLVVRVANAPGRPVWAEVGGLSLSGREHCFYLQANRYTGLFWPVTREDAEAALTRVGLVSVDAFKRRAVRRGFATGLDLRAPQSGDLRPQSPVPLD